MIRRAAIARGIPYTTTLSAAAAAADAIIALHNRTLAVRSLQDRIAANEAEKAAGAGRLASVGRKAST